MDHENKIKELEENIDSLKSFIERYMELEKSTERPKDIFSVLSGSKEKKYQNSLKYFLDPQQPHGFKDAILKAFLKEVYKDSTSYFQSIPYKSKDHHVEIQDEVWITDMEDEEDGRIDLIIAGGPTSQGVPEWAVFAELKVGAPEGNEQTDNYSRADSWNFNWFDKNRLKIGELNEYKYIYIKKENESVAGNEDFISVSWKDLEQSFEDEINKGLFDFPHRSVIQFLDFLRSLKEVENMEDEAKKRDLEQVSERLELYFEQKDLIKKVEEANRQFQHDFEKLSDNLHEIWDDRLSEIYDFSSSDWLVIPSSKKYENILPKYWYRRPIEGNKNKMKLFFVHSTTTDHLREKELRFRFRLPPARAVHRKKFESNKSFNDLFLEKMKDKREDIKKTLKDPSETKLSFDSASALIEKRYDLEKKDLFNSYLKNLENACEEFCENEGLIRVINECFESTYKEAFGKEPEGSEAIALIKN